jgi:hypothetical protein
MMVSSSALFCYIMDATHHPVFPLSLQMVYEWFINRDIKRLEIFPLNHPE